MKTSLPCFSVRRGMRFTMEKIGCVMGIGFRAYSGKQILISCRKALSHFSSEQLGLARRKPPCVRYFRNCSRSLGVKEKVSFPDMTQNGKSKSVSASRRTEQKDGLTRRLVCLVTSVRKLSAKQTELLLPAH